MSPGGLAVSLNALTTKPWASKIVWRIYSSLYENKAKGSVLSFTTSQIVVGFNKKRLFHDSRHT